MSIVDFFLPPSLPSSYDLTVSVLPLSPLPIHSFPSPVVTVLLYLMACIQSVKSVPLEKVTNIRPHELAQHLHSSQPYMLLDCRPVLAYNTCHISGAVNVNFTGEAHSVCVSIYNLFYLKSKMCLRVCMYVHCSTNMYCTCRKCSA